MEIQISNLQQIEQAARTFIRIMPEHNIFAFYGSMGAGKTTFIKVITGLLTSYKAQKVSYKGKNTGFRDKSFKNDRYAVFSEDNSFQFFTFREYISYVFQAYKKKLPNIDELIGGFHFEEYTDEEKKCVEQEKINFSCKFEKKRKRNKRNSFHR